jgi:hypothetical protein
MKESPIFVKRFETLRWILHHSRKFPKHQCFVMASRIEEAALDFTSDTTYGSPCKSKECGYLRSILKESIPKSHYYWFDILNKSDADLS